MRGNDFLDKMELIDPVFIEAADTKPTNTRNTWVKWSAMAACFCLVAALAAAIPHFLPEEIPAPPESNNLPTFTAPVESVAHTEPPRHQWTVYYNEPGFIVDSARRIIPGYFTEELSDAELAALEPAMHLAYMEFSGRAGFDGNGSPIEVFLNVTTSIPGHTVNVIISESELAQCYALGEEPAISTCNRVDFTVYQWIPTESNIVLEADARIGQYNCRFTLETTPEFVDRTKADFQEILECYSCWADGKPDLSVITADEIPEYFDLKLTLAEAQADPFFGAYMLGSVPSGFVEESIRRYKDQSNDYLSGVWTKGYDEIRWKVYFYSDQDASRLTGNGDTENYDLSLYPIPRADSVPEELREIVNDPIFIAEDLTLGAVYARAWQSGDSGDGSGLRMNFSIKHGDVIVQVSTKGVEPEWLYQQLTNLPE